MANYVNKLVTDYGQAAGAQTPAIVSNALQNKKRNALLERQDSRAQQQFDIEQETWPYKFKQMKSRHISSMAKNIMALPQQERSSRYEQLVNKIAPMPITENEQLGPLGVIDSNQFLAPDRFVKLTDDQQQKYLSVVSSTAEQLAKLDLSDKRVTNKIKEIEAQTTSAMKKILAKKEADIELEGVRQKGRIELEKIKGKTGAGADKTQNRIDKYRKEVANLASVRQRIRKGNDMYQLGQMMASLSGNKDLAIDKNEGVDSALKKVDEYENWLRGRLRKLEGGSNMEDPLGLF